MDVTGPRRPGVLPLLLKHLLELGAGDSGGRQRVSEGEYLGCLLVGDVLVEQRGAGSTGVL